MTDERVPEPVERRDNSGVYAAIEGLRDDVREDNDRLERRLMAGVHEFAIRHGQEHLVERDEKALAHERFDAFIRSAELAQARREGALGVFRFVLEQLSRHWKPVFAILSGVAAVVLAAEGNIRFEVIAR